MSPPPTESRWPLASALVGALVMAATILGLHRLGTGALAAPPVGSVERLRDWAAVRDPVTVGLAAVRLAALGLAYHLVATSVVAAAGRLLQRPRLVRVAEASTPRPLRGALRRTVGAAVSLTAAATTALPAVTGPDRVVVASPRDDEPTGRAALERIDPQAPVVLQRLTSEPTGTDGATLRRIDDPASPPVEHHLVRPGDHLWSISEAKLAGVLGRPPDDREITRYWRVVVAANPQLGDPDLLHPGQHVTVPPVPGQAPPASGLRSPSPGSASLRRLPPPDAVR
ncbi:MAG: hypothetical protein JWM47_1460 [Acidimicrobiales bacterium]|nr:hypothetical protein [Acidimicrobiales bacterium]